MMNEPGNTSQNALRALRLREGMVFTIEPMINKDTLRITTVYVACRSGLCGGSALSASLYRVSRMLRV